MDGKTYTVVGLDGGEYENIEYALIREWYAAKLVNEESLVFSAETGEWKKLINVFNLAELNAARNLLFQQNRQFQTTFAQPLPLPAPPVDQSFNQSSAPAFNAPIIQSFQPPHQNYQTGKTKTASAWKTVAGVLGVFFVGIFVFLAVGAYYFGKIAKTEFSRQTSNEGHAKILTEIKKFELPGDEFNDKMSGAKVLLPKDWRMLAPDNPIINIHNREQNETEAKKLNLSENTMLATDQSANRVLLVEIINFPAGINRTLFFNKSVELVEKEIAGQSKPGTYKRVAEYSTVMGSGLAKKFVFERVSKFTNPKMAEFGITDDDKIVKGQIVLMTNGENAFILQMWTEKELYDEAAADFEFIEKNSSMPPASVK